MKRYEKESLFKNFLVFFSLLEILLTLLFTELYHTETREYKQNLFKTMQVCSYTMECSQFTFDFAPKDKKKLNTFNEKGVYAYFHIPMSKEYNLKISYPQQSYLEDIKNISNTLWIKFTFATLLLFFLALLFTFYSLTPIRKALNLNDEFIKDILHDFNTPITSMILNIRMLQEDSGKNPFIERISHSIDNITLLQHNLKSFLHHSPSQNEEVDIVAICKDRLHFIQNIYPNLTYVFEVCDEVKKITNKELLTRILDNLLSNAAKYNKRDGEVRITVLHDIIRIKDTGKGIKDIKRVKERYYKEQERGLGLGLAIVHKLTLELDIIMHIESNEHQGTTILLDLKNVNGS